MGEPQQGVIVRATYWINPLCRSRQRGVYAKKRIKGSRMSADTDGEQTDGEQTARARSETGIFLFSLARGEKARDRIRGKMAVLAPKRGHHP